ncbi:hypothetical protein HMPREF0373_01759 [Eubacterium ramulus ATCC 29099]|uniref:Uncharacterized protein n=1 Tax=Eubacterium ramulus ATCC 29099 TaxID=1256908 RepID=U2QYM3_EUBRA|nr:hypothetical protein HMPREF0373_01759 [Eubacterium ramulus ATCC 29099]
MSVSEPTAVSAVGEFAGGGGDKRRSANRKLFVSLHMCCRNPFIS